MRRNEDLGELFELENAETLLILAGGPHWANSYEAIALKYLEAQNVLVMAWSEIESMVSEVTFNFNSGAVLF